MDFSSRFVIQFSLKMNCELFIKIRHPNFIENELWTFHEVASVLHRGRWFWVHPVFIHRPEAVRLGFVNERGATFDVATGSRRCTRTGKPVDILKSIVLAGVVLAAAPLRNCAFSDDQIWRSEQVLKGFCKLDRCIKRGSSTRRAHKVKNLIQFSLFFVCFFFLGALLLNQVWSCSLDSVSGKIFLYIVGSVRDLKNHRTRRSGCVRSILGFHEFVSGGFLFSLGILGICSFCGVYQEVGSWVVVFFCLVDRFLCAWI